MTNLEHDLLVALRRLQAAALVASTRESMQMKTARHNAERLLKKHDPEYTCPICDGGPGNHCACGCLQS